MMYSSIAKFFCHNASGHTFVLWKFSNFIRVRILQESVVRILSHTLVYSMVDRLQASHWGLFVNLIGCIGLERRLFAELIHERLLNFLSWNHFHGAEYNFPRLFLFSICCLLSCFDRRRSFSYWPNKFTRSSIEALLRRLLRSLLHSFHSMVQLTLYLIEIRRTLQQRHFSGLKLGWVVQL